MIKKFLPIFLALSACSPTSLTPQETETDVSRSLAAQACFQKGWVSNPPVVAAYLTFLQTKLRNRGNPSSIAQAQQRISPSIATITPAHCRQVEMLAYQHAQQEADRTRQYQEFGEAIDGISASAAQTQSSYQPRTIMCQHYQWGNMTGCNAF